MPKTPPPAKPKCTSPRPYTPKPPSKPKPYSIGGSRRRGSKSQKRNRRHTRRY